MEAVKFHTGRSADVPETMFRRSPGARRAPLGEGPLPLARASRIFPSKPNEAATRQTAIRPCHGPNAAGVR